MRLYLIFFALLSLANATTLGELSSIQEELIDEYLDLHSAKEYVQAHQCWAKEYLMAMHMDEMVERLKEGLCEYENTDYPSICKHFPHFRAAPIELLLALQRRVKDSILGDDDLLTVPEMREMMSEYWREEDLKKAKYVLSDYALMRGIVCFCQSKVIDPINLLDKEKIICRISKFKPLALIHFYKHFYDLTEECTRDYFESIFDRHFRMKRLNESTVMKVGRFINDMVMTPITYEDLILQTDFKKPTG